MGVFRVDEYEAAGRQQLYEIQHEMMRSQSPLYAQIRMERMDSVGTSRVALADDQVVERAPVSMATTFVIERDTVVQGRFEEVWAAIDSMATEALGVLIPQMLEHVGAISDASGQTVDAGGVPINYDLILDAIEKLEITFDEDGNANFPTLVMNPADSERLRAMGPPTSAQEERLAAIMEAKRVEADARRRSRRLS